MLALVENQVCLTEKKTFCSEKAPARVRIFAERMQDFYRDISGLITSHEQITTNAKINFLTYCRFNQRNDLRRHVDVIKCYMDAFGGSIGVYQMKIPLQRTKDLQSKILKKEAFSFQNQSLVSSTTAEISSFTYVCQRVLRIQLKRLHEKLS